MTTFAMRLRKKLQAFFEILIQGHFAKVQRKQNNSIINNLKILQL